MVGRLTRNVDTITNKKISAGECLIKAHELGDNETALIKSIDRLHNMENIDSLSDIKKERIASETLEYFTFLFLYGKHTNNNKKINKILISSAEYLGIKNTKYFDINSILSSEESYFDKNFYVPDFQNEVSP